MRTINPNNLSPRMPLISTIAWFLLLDRFNAPGWVWGVIGVLTSAAWVAWISHMCNDEWGDVPGFGRGDGHE